MIIAFIIITAIFALVAAAILAEIVMKKPAGTKEMQRISRLIQKGAVTFLNKEYKIMLYL